MAELRLEEHRDRPGCFTVWVDGVPSSPVDTAHPERLAFEYLAWMDAIVGAVRGGGPVQAVHLGAAACALPWAWSRTRPGSRQLAVEIDTELAALVREWFPTLPRSPHLRIRVGDAAAVLATGRGASADVIVRDAFACGATPTHLTTDAFLADAARVLRPDGLYLANVADGPPLSLLRAEVATAATAFRYVLVVAEPGALKGRRFANAVLVGSQDPLDVTGIHRAVARIGVSTTVLWGDPLRRFTAGAKPISAAR